MYKVKDRLELQLLINDKEFPFEGVNALDFLHMSSSTRLGVPMIHFKVLDSARWFSDNQCLVDGALINVVINVRGNKRAYKFRYNVHRETQGTTGPTYEVDGYFDCPTYWLHALSSARKGTSNTVLEALASECKLAYEGTPTADNQTWQTKNRKAFQFAQEVCRHGYVDEKSCMKLALDFDGTLIYRNVVSNFDPTAKFVLGQYLPNTYVVTDFRPRNSSGILNSISGYAEELHTTPLLDPDKLPFTKVDVKKITKSIMVNTDVHKLIERSRVMFQPIDCGNTHESYDRAAYQNERIGNMYSYGMDVVTPDVTETRLLDYVDFVVNEPGGKANKSFSGRYLITSKAIYIAGINYFERVELSRQGVNTRVSNQA